MKSRRIWVTALILSVLLGLGALIGTSPSFEKCEHERKNHQSYSALHEESPLLVKAIVRLKLHASCARQTASENDGAIAGLSGIAVALFTLALWISTEKMWKASLVQAEIAKRSFDSADRPWVLFHLSVKSVEQTQYGTLFRISVTAQNYGKIPAVKVNIRTEAIKTVGIYTEGGVFDPRQEERAITEFYERALFDGRTWVGSILGSNEKTALDTGANFAKKENWPRSKSDIWLPPIISVSITYRSPEWEADRIAQTAATYIVGISDGSSMRGLEQLTVPSGFHLIATDGGAFSRVT